MDARDVINRIKNLQLFEVQVTMPKQFQFSGSVPFDMEILGDQAFVKVYAETIEEATRIAKEYLSE